MSYQVLARKWRPQHFDEVVGQEHVLRALTNALDNDRLHHAYLFTGTRGVGKTTLARIFARCLNCEQGVSSKACNQCTACTDIAEGRFVDLIEVDAASRTKVEDTRELLDNVQYMPTAGRYKVYLIDEVHMLSSHSFNALLKTLEEPPPHVKFLLATTDPQKLPVTILSRCLQFNLKNLSPERIVEHLAQIMTVESVPVEEAALWVLARAADGSMRDALSLADQAIAHGGGKLVESELSTMLGTVNRSAVLELCRAVADRDAGAVLEKVARLAEHGPDYAGVLGDILSVWHRVAVCQAVPEALDNSQGDREAIVELAGRLSREDVQLFYQICLLGRRDLTLAVDQRSGLEMALLRQLAFQPVLPEAAVPPIESSATGTGATQPGASTRGDGAGKKLEPGPLAPALPATGTAELDRQASVRRQDGASRVAASLQTQKDSDALAGEGEAPTGRAQGDQIRSAPVAAEVADSAVSPASSQVSLAPSEPGCPPNTTASHAKGNPAESGSGARTDSDWPAPAGIESLTPDVWLRICHQLPINGRLLAVASNLVLDERESDEFRFRLEDCHSALYDERHQQALAAALGQYLGEGVRVVIAIAPVDEETPALYRMRIAAERRQRAIETLREDPTVKALAARFGGTLLEDTVIAIDSGGEHERA